MRRQAPLRLAWRLEALNKLVVEATRAIEMNRRTVGKTEIDRRSVVAVEVVLRGVLQNAREIRDSVADDVAEFGSDDDLAVLVTREARS